MQVSLTHGLQFPTHPAFFRGIYNPFPSGWYRPTHAATMFNCPLWQPSGHLTDRQQKRSQHPQRIQVGGEEQVLRPIIS